MSIVKTNFFFLVEIFSILSQIYSNNNLKSIFPEPKIILTVYDYGKNRTSYHLYKLNDNGNHEQLSFRISYLMEKNLSSIEKFSKFYNKKWMFFTQDKEIIEFIIDENEKLIKKSKPLYKIFGIIFPNNISVYTNKSTSLSLYHIEENYINDFISFDIFNQTKNTYFIITQRSIIYEIPSKYLLITSTVSLIISIFILIYWNYRLRTSPNVISLHKYLISLPYLNIILAILVSLEAYDMIDQDPNKEEDNSIYLETGLFTVNAVYRSVLWILFVLVAAGWQISKQSFNTKEVKHFIQVFVFIYLMMCIDQIVDSLNSSNHIFKASEIENFFFYIIMIIYITFKGINTINFLKRKLQYSAVFNTLQYIPGLKIKINMMKKHIRILYIFEILYVLTMIIHKFLFLKYDTQKFEIIQYHYIDLIFMIMFLFIFRPIKLPEFFDVDYGEDINDNSKVYKCKIPLIEEFFDLNKPIKKIIQNSEKNYYINENIPVVIINPCLGNKINNHNIDTIITNSDIGYLSDN